MRYAMPEEVGHVRIMKRCHSDLYDFPYKCRGVQCSLVSCSKTNIFIWAQTSVVCFNSVLPTNEGIV